MSRVWNRCSVYSVTGCSTTNGIPDPLEGTGEEFCFSHCSSGIKTVDNFYAWKLLCNLTEAQVIGVNSLNNWAALGPSVALGIGLIFSRIEKLIELTQCLIEVVKEVDWNRLCINIPEQLRINNKMVEHALCEFSKHCRFTNSDPSKKFKSRSALDDV